MRHLILVVFYVILVAVLYNHHDLFLQVHGRADELKIRALTSIMAIVCLVLAADQMIRLFSNEP